MKNGFWGAAISAVAGALLACGGNPADPNGGERSTGVHIALSGGTSTHVAATPMATLVIQNVFDASQSYLVECMKKDHPLDGLDFCDELVVLPPGVYEIIVQSHDGCVSPQDHYKIIVKPRETVELKIDLTCGGSTGGLDVIVTENHVPAIVDIDFTFGNGATANKFVCHDGQDVNVTLTVHDVETACDSLSGHWLVQVGGEWVWANPMSPPPPIASIAPYAGDCKFTATIDAHAPIGDYTLKLKVFDGTLWGWLSFPIHIIDCGYGNDCDP